MRPQILIIGAGPVGLTLACELARYSIPIRIIDKASHRTDKSKAVVIWTRTLELLDRTGCLRDFLDVGVKCRAVNLIGNGAPMARITLGKVDSPYPFGLLVPQSETERLLEEHLARLGVTVDRETALVAFDQQESSVTAHIQQIGAPEETVTADWLVGCDGAHSTVRHQLGLAFAGETLPSAWCLADVHVAGLPYPPDEMAIFLHQNGVLAFFPLTRERYRIIASVAAAGAIEPATPTLADIQRLLDERGPPGMIVSNPIWLSGFRINERKVADYRSGRVFVAGDAAHVHSPAGGQGMNTGMQDAFNLAWKLALVCRGSSPAEPLLDSYGEERSPVAEQVLKETGRLTAVGMLQSHAAQALRNGVARLAFGLAPVRQFMAETVAEVSVGYDGSPLNGAGDHEVAGPPPGARMPPPAGQPPCGAGERPLFTLMASSSDEGDDLLRRYPDLLGPPVAPAQDTKGLRLIRPDGYVAAVARDANAIATYLDRFDGA